MQSATQDALRSVAAMADVAGTFDAGDIIAAWQRLAPAYDVEQWVLPLPPWARRPYAESGPDAWQRVRDHLAVQPAAGPICIYMHVPFCSSKCGFCDSYSFKLGNHGEDHVEGYVSLLEREMNVWSRQGGLAQRPVSTVHFGGGTPVFLGAKAFARLVESCAGCFGVGETTEWALESTARDLAPNILDLLHGLGFRRLHVGVQSLEDPVRTAIGRRLPAAAVLRKIEEVLSLGWVVSVDLLCGLPHQTPAGFLSGLAGLVDLGVDGFSLYELLIYRQNLHWAEGYGLSARTHLPNYFMFQAGAHYLEARGFRKNLFNHWANERDENVYFTFPTRGEDLLAMGAIADGVFGDYHYRHGRYSSYLGSSTPEFPGLEGGLARNGLENVLRPLVVALLAGRLRPAAFRDALGPPARPLLELWQRCGLLSDAGEPGALVLTPSGSWFAGNMLLQLEDAFVHRPAGAA